jgi:hypothetical protein
MVPSLLASKNLEGSLNVRASPAAFADGLAISGGQLSDALQHTSRTLTAADEMLRRAKDARQQEVEARWVNDQLFASVNKLSEWQADPENNSKEEFADEFSAVAGKIIGDSSTGAPSPTAASELKSKLQARIIPLYQGALHTGERTRLDNNRSSIVSQTSFALDTYRSGLGSGTDPIGGVVSSREDLHGGVDRLFGGKAPELADKLHAYIDVELALGTAREHPGYAKSLIEVSTSIPEESKATLYNKIESLSRAQDAIRVNDFNHARADYLVGVSQGKVSGTIPLSKYAEVFPKDRAVIEKREDDEKIDIATTTKSEFDKVAPMSPALIDRYLNNAAKNVKDVRTAKIYRDLNAKLRDVRELQDKDRVSWLVSFNPEVKATEDDVARAYDLESQTSALNRRNQAIKKYQGFPSDTDSNHEMFMRLSSNDKSLIPVSMAKQYAARINTGTPSEVMQRIDDVMRQFPDIEDKAIAFSDLTSLPNKEGIRQEYQVAYQNQGQWWIPTYLSALSSTEAVKKLDDVRERDIETSITRNPTWMKFQAAMIGPDLSRANEIEGFKTGIQTMARSMHLQGRQVEGAVNTSVDLLLNSTMGFTTIHGRPLMISRENPSTNTTRSDDDIRDIGRRLEVSLRDLDPRMVNQDKFSVLDQVHPDKNHINRLQAFRDIITSSGFFVTDPNGQSMTLFVPGEKGIPVQITDNKNQAFRIYLNDLPDYQKSEKRIYSTGEQTFAEFEGKFPIEPEKTYPLQGIPPGVNILDRILGSYKKRTYWPTNTFKLEKK